MRPPCLPRPLVVLTLVVGLSPALVVACVGAAALPCEAATDCPIGTRCEVGQCVAGAVGDEGGEGVGIEGEAGEGEGGEGEGEGGDVGGDEREGDEGGEGEGEGEGGEGEGDGDEGEGEGEVGEGEGEVGEVEVEVEVEECSGTPIRVASLGRNDGDNTGLPTLPLAPSGCDANSQFNDHTEVWQFTADRDGTLTVTLTPAESIDLDLLVRRVECLEQTNQLCEDFGGDGEVDFIDVEVAPNETIFIFAAGVVDEDQGLYDLNLAFE